MSDRPQLELRPDLRRVLVCADCGQAWQALTTDLGRRVCGRCRGWHES